MIAGLSWYIQRVQHKAEIAEMNLVSMKESFKILEGANKQNEKTIDFMSKSSQTDSQFINQALENNELLIKEDAKKTASRKELGKQNAIIKNYLDQPVPDDLRSVLNRQTAKYRGGNEVDTSVPASGPAPPAKPAASGPR